MEKISTEKSPLPKKETWSLDDKRFSYFVSKRCKAPSAIWGIPDLINCILNDEELKVRTEEMRSVYRRDGKSKNSLN